MINLSWRNIYSTLKVFFLMQIHRKHWPDNLDYKHFINKLYLDVWKLCPPGSIINTGWIGYFIQTCKLKLWLVEYLYQNVLIQWTCWIRASGYFKRWKESPRKVKTINLGQIELKNVTGVYMNGYIKWTDNTK